MKLFIILAAIAWSNGAKLDRTYLPPNHAQTSGGSGNFLQTPVSGSDFQNYNQNGQDFQNYAHNDDSFAQNGNNFAQNGNGFAQNVNFAQDNTGFNDEGRPERAQAAFERNAAILRQDNQNDGETYAYAYETENGITAEENGVATNGVEAQGGYSYTGDDGQVYTVRYTAGQNGFVPEGDHLPTPPPIPEEILKALEQNARDEANGIFDDGSYSEGKYNDDANNQYNEGYNYNNGNGNNFNAGGDFNNNFNSADNSDDDSVVTTNALIRSNNGLNNNGVEKAYLPPFQQNGQRSQGFNQPQANYNQPQANFNQPQANYNQQQANYNQPQTSINQPQNNGFRNQAQNVEKAYLPPEQFGQRQNGGNNRYQARNGLRNQAQRVEKAYLPPFDRSQTAAIVGPSFDQAQNYRSQARGPASNAANREYLPPSANQRSNGRGFPRRPSFNARNGYQY